MGCDIHCYFEHRIPGTDYWSSLPRINPGRCYDIFARLAGVRNYDDVTPIVEPRGLPEKVGFWADMDNWLLVNDEHDGDSYCSTENAKRWIESELSKPHYDGTGKLSKVSHPDWHSHSWVTTEEFITVVEEFFEKFGPEQIKWCSEYLGFVAYMRELTKRGFETRLVFWFDN